MKRLVLLTLLAVALVSMVACRASGAIVITISSNEGIHNLEVPKLRTEEFRITVPTGTVDLNVNASCDCELYWGGLAAGVRLERLENGAFKLTIPSSYASSKIGELLLKTPTAEKQFPIFAK